MMPFLKTLLKRTLTGISEAFAGNNGGGSVSGFYKTSSRVNQGRRIAVGAGGSAGEAVPRGCSADGGCRCGTATRERVVGAPDDGECPSRRCSRRGRSQQRWRHGGWAASQKGGMGCSAARQPVIRQFLGSGVLAWSASDGCARCLSTRPTLFGQSSRINLRKPARRSVPELVFLAMRVLLVAPF